MQGGPLDRVRTESEWKRFVREQPEKNRSWYGRWAQDARNKPHQQIKRELA